MQYWLVKSEPETWSWTDQVHKGEKGEPWTGVRNYQASNYMKQMQLGDRCFFYHSVTEKSVVGIVEVCETYQPDPTDETGKFGMVVVKAIQPLPRPVSLEMIKSDPALNNMPLIRQSRLSVMPVSKIEWDIILATSTAQG